jgi:hypothetical protein
VGVYWDLLNGVKTSVQSTPLCPPVVLRDDLILLEGEKVPLVLIAPGPGMERIRMQTFGKNIAYEYEVLVAYIVAGNRTLSADLQSYLDTREAIRDQLYQIQAPGIEKAWDTHMEIGAVSKFAALVDSNYKVTGWEMRYSINSQRLGN